MFGVLIERMVEAYAAPQRSAQRILTRAPGLGDSVVMALAGIVLSLCMIKLVEVGSGVTIGEAMLELARHVWPDEQIEAPAPIDQPAWPVALIVDIGSHLALSSIFVLIATGFGRLVGGGGGFAAVAAVVAWWILATAPSQIVQSGLLIWTGLTASALAAVLLLATQLYLLYMFAAFLAQAHGFRSPLSVMLALLVGGLALLLSPFSAISG